MAPILTESPAAGAVAAEVLAGLYQRLSACLVDPSWSSNPAAVKQARILSRRLKAALEFFGGKPLRLVRQLDRATAPLAKLRDVDAIADLLAKRGQPDALVVLSAQRAKGQLRTAKVAAWVAALDADLDAHAERLLEAPPVPLDAFGADQLRRRREQFALRLASAGRTDSAPNFAGVHRARRALRRLRYDLEALRPWLPDTKAALKPIKATLDELGALADLDAGRHWLRKNGYRELAASLDREIGEVLPTAWVSLGRVLPAFDAWLAS